MCVLCGEFVASPHWTDRKFEDAVREGRIPEGEYQMMRRRGRIQRAKLVGEVLSRYGLKLSDWSGTKYILRDGKGRAEIMGDLGGVWTAAERMLGKAPDPLDPGLLEKLRAG
ncbi:MAG: hypothetical protein ACRDSJ_02300 [Rubrobacteraceae bacterium]